MKVIAHPRFQELLSLIEKTPRLAKRWRGIVFHSVIPDGADHVKVDSQHAPFNIRALDAINRGGDQCHPLTAPAVRPLMNSFWSRRKRTMGGTTASKVPAMRTPYS